MSLITTCPACSTSFYVTQDQLNAHQGDVRCGKCQHVFNARKIVTELPEPVSEPESILDVDEVSIPDVNELEIIEETSAKPVFEILEPQPEPEVTEVESAIFEPEPAIENVETSPQVDISDVPPVEPAIATPIPPADNAYKISFASKPKAQSHPVIFSVLSLLLLVLAATQTVYFLRSPLAIKFPALKPLLVKACAPMGCEIALPRHIDQIVIDDSDLQEDADHEGLIHLSATIVNNAAYVQEYPLFELSLTDINDKPVLRKAFQPSEYLPSGTNPSNGIGAGEELHIKLDLTASGEPVAGYRVLAVY